VRSGAEREVVVYPQLEVGGVILREVFVASILVRGQVPYWGAGIMVFVLFVYHLDILILVVRSLVIEVSLVKMLVAKSEI